MQELLQKIDNTDKLAEIVNHAADFLINNQNEEKISKHYNKYHFHNPEEFLRLIKLLAQTLRNACTNDATETELLAEFADLNTQLQQSLWSTYKKRHEDIYSFVLRVHNAQELALVETFDWDLRYIMGDSNYPDNRRLLAYIDLHCRLPNGKHEVVQFQADEEKLDQLISELEKANKLYAQT